MNLPVLAITLTTLSIEAPKQVDVVCRAYCSAIDIADGLVRYAEYTPREAIRSFGLGRYVPKAQGLVPSTEAPIRDLSTLAGWRVIVSAFLDHEDFMAKVRFRCFGLDGRLAVTGQGLAVMEDTALGRLFGGSDEIFAISSIEGHSYNALTEVWLLPPRGNPKRLLILQGEFGKFRDGTGGARPGVTIGRQTYDGVNAGSKGVVEEFYVWDSVARTLTLRAR